MSDLVRDDSTELLRRWRLILGPAADGGDERADPNAPAASGDFDSGENARGKEARGTGRSVALKPKDAERDRLLEALYGREYALREREASPQARRAGQRSSGLDAPTWIQRVRELFPASTAEYLQREGLERYGLAQLLADPEVLARATPDMQMVRLLVRCRGLLPPPCLPLARRLIRQVIAELEQRLSRTLPARFSPRRQRGAHGGPRRLSELDWPRTLRRNLRHFDLEADALILRQLYFHARQRRHLPWELVLLVDQSASMLDSVIHAAVLASVLCGVSSLRTRLVLFDTRIVDLGEQLQDPVEILLGVQLGGGTDIAGAVAYAGSQLQQPGRSLVVLISDFYEGGDGDALLREVGRLAAGGVRLLGLAALDREAQPDYDQRMARALVEAGMPVAAMTPDRLADWIARQMA